MEVTLNLPKKIYLDLSESAKKSKRTFDDVVSERLRNKSENPLAANLDEEVLEAAKLWIPENQSARHSRLLYKNQAGTLTASEKKELDFFFSRFTESLCCERRRASTKRCGAVSSNRLTI